MGKVLREEAARADEEVSCLAVTALSGRQTGVWPGCAERCTGILLLEAVERGRLRGPDGVPYGLFRDAETVHDNQNGGCFHSGFPHSVDKDSGPRGNDPGRGSECVGRDSGGGASPFRVPC